MKKVLVYGVGCFFENHEEQLKEEYDIVGYVDRSGSLRGQEIPVHVSDFQGEYDQIVVMVTKISSCFEITAELLNAPIPCEQILLGCSLWGEYALYDAIKVMPNGKYLLVKDDLNIQVGTEDEFMNVTEVLLMHCYHYELSGGGKEVIFDVGMNIGDATLYFLTRPNVEKVYAYEPFKKTYGDALENLNEYLDSPRLAVYQFGLSDHNEDKEIVFHQNMSCGQSTIPSVNEQARQNYGDWGLLQGGDARTEWIQIRKSSEVFAEILEKHANCKFILKVDCEGEEYAIFQDLDRSGLLKRFHFVMAEWHYKGAGLLLECLRNNGFSLFTMQKSLQPQLGLVYAWKDE